MQSRSVFERVLAFGAYIVRIPGTLIVQVASIVAVLLIAVLPAVLVYWYFPRVWEGFRRISNQEDISGYLDEIGFVALVSALGLAPYLFSKSINVIPKLIGAIVGDLKHIAVGPWLPSLQPSKHQSGVLELARMRTRGLLSTSRSSIPLMLGFTGIAVAVELAYLAAAGKYLTEPQPREVTSSVVELMFFDEYSGTPLTEPSIEVPSCPDDLDGNGNGEEASDDGAESAVDTDSATPEQVQGQGLEEIVIVGTASTRYPAICFKPL